MFRENLLQGQNILITGGGTGLGRAMAMRLAELGATVAILGRRPDPLRETVAEIGDKGGQAAWSSADVRDPEGVSQAVVTLEDEIGHLTGLINSAAGNFLSASEDLSAGAFNAVVQIVLYGTYNVTMALGRRWIERGTRGHVLSIVTTYSWTGSPFVMPSACAKAAVLSMMRSLAVEWGTYGIRCNAIAPGFFPTQGAFSRLMPPDFQFRGGDANPLGRFGRPEELADLAAFLFSPMASYINGECVVIDGGEWLKAQGFSRFTDFPRDEIKGLMRAMKPKK